MLTQQEIKLSISRLKENIPDGATIGFYPSSGNYLEAFNFDEIPLDYVICCDNSIEEQQSGKIITVRADNNLCLRFIIEAGLKLDAIFAIQDGFVEGDNYELVNSVGFLSRSLPALNDVFVLVNNPHNKNYRDFNYGPIKKLRSNKTTEQYRRGKYSAYDLNVNGYIIQRYKKDYKTSVRIEISDGYSFKIERKSIWEDQNRLDGIFIFKENRLTGKYKKSLQNYWPEDYMPKLLHDIFEITEEGNIKDLLRYAEKKSLKRIGVVPFAKGRERVANINGVYEQMIKDIENWPGDYPHQIRFYHLDKSDFQPVYTYINEKKPEIQIGLREVDKKYMDFLVFFFHNIASYHSLWSEDISRMICHFVFPLLSDYMKTGNIPKEFAGGTYSVIEGSGDLLPPGCIWVSKSGRFSAHDLAYVRSLQSYMLWDIKRKVHMPMAFHDIEGVDEKNNIVFCRGLGDFHAIWTNSPLTVNFDYIEASQFWKSGSSHPDMNTYPEKVNDFLEFKADSSKIQLTYDPDYRDISCIFETPNYWDLSEKIFREIIQDNLSEEQELLKIKEIDNHPFSIYYGGKEHILKTVNKISTEKKDYDKICGLFQKLMEISEKDWKNLPF